MLALHGIHGCMYTYIYIYMCMCVCVFYWHNDMMNLMGLSENWGWSRNL